MIATYSPDLIPSVFYEDARAGIAFLKTGFGFEEHLLAPGPDGTLAHCELRLGRGLVMVGDAGRGGEERKWTTPARLGGRGTAGIYVAVPDVEERYARARAAGVTFKDELHETDYGSRDFSAFDPAGNTWSFGTYHPLAGHPGEEDAGKGLPAEIYATTRYRDARTAIAFLCAAFGFEEHVVYAEGDVVHHAELRVGSSIFMFGSSRDDGHATLTPAETGGAVTESYYVVVPDVDAHAARAIAAGARLIRPPADTDHGSRDYGVRDCEGQEWWFGTYRPKTHSA